VRATTAVTEISGPRAGGLFERSLNPMLLVDDERRYVDANAAARLFLRLPVTDIRRLSVGDLTPSHLRPQVDEMWSGFLAGREPRSARTIPWDLVMPDGACLSVDLGVIPNVGPGRHLAIFLFPAARALNERLRDAAPPADRVLTTREREVLTLVALGNTGAQIAAQLYLSPATVQTHVTNALIKLGAKNRAHGISLALQLGELAVGEWPWERRLALSG
jgi:DNA-binding CsgD family transcriptional regulator